MSRFRFTIEHTPGRKNRVDGLSRQPDYEPEHYEELEDKVLLPREVFVNQVIELSSPLSMSALRHDPEDMPEEIQKKLDRDSWTSVDSLVHDAGNRIVVPQDAVLRKDII